MGFLLLFPFFLSPAGRFGDDDASRFGGMKLATVRRGRFGRVYQCSKPVQPYSLVVRGRGFRPMLKQRCTVRGIVCGEGARVTDDNHET